MTSPRIRITCLLVASVAGCGGGAGSGGGPIPLARLDPEFGAVFCRKIFTCCDAAERAMNIATRADEATCRAMVGSWVDPFAFAPALDAGTVIYHGDRARRCLDTLVALPCSQWGGNQELTRYPDCTSIFEGTIAVGGACPLRGECADSWCDRSTGVATCAPLPRLGESCVPGRCAAGLLCPNTSPLVCIDPRPDGAPCNSGLECASASCAIQPGGSSSTCGPPTFCNGV